MRRPGVIAIVDDEEEVRLSTRNLLRSYGVQALVFESAEAFLAGADLACIEGLVTDFRLPGMSGADLIEAVRARGASFPVVLISAHEVGPRILARRDVAFLHKPVDPDDLMRRLGLLPPAP